MLCVKPLRQAAVGLLDNPGSILFSDENVHTISSRLVQVHNDLIIFRPISTFPFDRKASLKIPRFNNLFYLNMVEVEGLKPLEHSITGCQLPWLKYNPIAI